MWLIIFVLYFEFNDTLGCRGYPPPPPPDGDPSMSKIYYFSNSSTWGGWDPDPNNNTWKLWIEYWGKPNTSNFDSTEEGRHPLGDAGWPRYWKGLGQGIKGVPPPPWAYVPLSYGKPQHCFLQPVRGKCKFFLFRWGFNPTHNSCRRFLYSGCGGNQNNFLNEKDCKKSCVDVPSTGCEAQAKINFEEFIYE